NLDGDEAMDILLRQYLVERYGYDDAQPERNSTSGYGVSNIEQACRILNIQVGAPLHIAEAAYRAAMKRNHPNAGGTVEQARNLTWAIEQLRAKHRRQRLCA